MLFTALATSTWYSQNQIWHRGRFDFDEICQNSKMVFRKCHREDVLLLLSFQYYFLQRCTEKTTVTYSKLSSLKSIFFSFPSFNIKYWQFYVFIFLLKTWGSVLWRSAAIWAGIFANFAPHLGGNRWKQITVVHISTKGQANVKFSTGIIIFIRYFQFKKSFFLFHLLFYTVNFRF